jgi:hypothetical protein
MWWLDVLGLAVVVALWFVVPRWVTLTSGFYRWVGWEHFVANARMQTGIVRVYRVVLGLIAAFALSNLVLSLTHAL